MQTGDPTPAGAGRGGLDPDPDPDLQARNAVGVFDDYEQADAAVAELVAAGHPPETVSDSDGAQRAGGVLGQHGAHDCASYCPAP
jgi:hypothetical protein